MKHIKKWLIWTWLPVMLLLWLLTPPSNSLWVKHTVFLVTITMQGLIFWLVSKAQSQEDEEKYFGLTEKLYGMTLFSAMAIYTKGIWIITPATSPIWLKHLFLGSGLFVLILCFLYFALKKVDEQADERFYMNLAKAACTTLVLIVLSLIVLSIVTFFLPFTLRTGMVLIFTASMIVFFDLFFLIFEKRG